MSSFSVTSKGVIASGLPSWSAMSTPTQLRLKALFVRGLKFTPTPAQLAAFEGDLRRLNAAYWKEAVLSVVRSKQISGRISNPATLRAAVNAIYGRKIAEASNLGVLLGTFECAFRSTVAVGMEDYFGMRFWWLGIENAMRNGNDATSITRIGTRPISRDLANVIGDILSYIDGDRNGNLVGRTLRTIKNGYELLGHTTLSQLQRLIENQWALFNPMYFGRPGRPNLTKGKFTPKFKRVRDARNDIFHHRPVAKKSEIVSLAEELMDYIDVSASQMVGNIAASTPGAFAFSRAVEKRHNP